MMANPDVKNTSLTQGWSTNSDNSGDFATMSPKVPANFVTCVFELRRTMTMAQEADPVDPSDFLAPPDPSGKN